jgi:hypothetical protein
MKALRRFAALSLAAALWLGAPGLPAWEAAARTVNAGSAAGAGLGAAALPPAAVSASAHAWQLRPVQSLFTVLPDLEGTSLPQPALLALERCLDRGGVEPAQISSLPPQRRLQEVRSSLKALSASLQEESPARERDASPSERLKSLALRRAALRDLRLSAAVLEARDRKAFLEALSVSETRVERKFREESARLVEGKIAQILPGGAASWRGRTADVELEDGSVLSFKRHKDLASLLNESGKMQEVLSFGIDAPIPLSRANWQFALKYPGKKEKSSSDAGDPAEERYLPYLMPKRLVDGYRGYLNDKLPKGLSAEQKVEKIESAALAAVEHMLVLLRNGRAHASLMPLSHHGTHWEWDFWRWNPPFLGEMRYGPSFINGWKEAFAYPNIRLSGLADWEHIEPLKHFYQTHEHDDHGDGTVHHDAYSLALGQNLAELSFILLHSGAVNGLSDDAVARVIVKAVRAYLTGLLPESSAARFSEREALAAARASSRSFRRAYRYWEAGTMFARMLFWGGLGGNAVLLALASPDVIPFLIQGLCLLHFLGKMDAAERISGNLPGSVVHPLLMSVVKPAVELLRRDAASVGLPALDHPSGSPWDFRQAMIFAFALPAALLIPTAIAGLFGLFGLQLAAAAGVLAHPLALAGLTGATLAFAAARVLSFLLSLRHASPSSPEFSAQAPATGPPLRNPAP